MTQLTRKFGRVIRLVLYLTFSVSVLAGCTTIPTSGPVVRVEKVPSEVNHSGVEITANPPQPGAKPADILAGFLTAMASGDGNYEAARAYLTPKAKETWDPMAGVSIYDGEGHPPVITDSSAVLSAPVTGVVDANGHYQSTYQENYSHNFGILKIDGEWRISSPPDGLLVSEYMFSRTYRPIPIYFMDRTEQYVVSEYIYLPDSQVNPTRVVQATIYGPSEWLRPAVTTAFPDDTRLAVSSVATNKDGIATISLSDSVAGLTNQQRDIMGIQLAYSLRVFADITGLKVTVNGSPYSMPGANQDGTLRIKSVLSYDPVSNSTPSYYYAVSDGKLVQVHFAADTKTSATTGGLGNTAWATGLAGIVVSEGQNLVYATDATRSQLLTSRIRAEGNDSEEARVVLSGTGLCDPAMVGDGVWTIGQSPQGPILYRAKSTGEISTTLITELSGMEVKSFSVSPDATKLAVVVGENESSRVGLLRLRGKDLVVDGWRPLAVNSSKGRLVSFTGVSWTSGNNLAMVASVSDDPGAASSVYLATSDGALVSTIGPLPSSSIHKLVTYPSREGINVLGVDESGTLWRFVGGSRWEPIVGGITAIAVV